MRKDRGIPYIYNADSQNVLQSIWKEKPWLRQPNEGPLEVKEVHGVFLGGTSDCCIVHGMGTHAEEFGVFIFSCMHSATLDIMHKRYWEESS